MDDQIGLLRHKLFLIQQGMAFNGKRTKTARSQGKKFQVSVEQEATRLLVRTYNIHGGFHNQIGISFHNFLIFCLILCRGIWVGHLCNRTTM